MLEEINRLKSLIDSLVTMSRADAGQIPMKLEVFPVAEIMEEAASLLDVLIEEKRLTFNFEGEKNALVRGDRLIRAFFSPKKLNVRRFSSISTSSRLAAS